MNYNKLDTIQYYINLKKVFTKTLKCNNSTHKIKLFLKMWFVKRLFNVKYNKNGWQNNNRTLGTFKNYKNGLMND